MVAVVPRRIHLWLLSVIGIFIIVITITSSDASSTVNSLDKLINVSGHGLSYARNNESINGNTTTTLLVRLEKTSFKCEGKPGRLCERESNRLKEVKLKPESSQRPDRSNSEKKVALQSRQIHVDSRKRNKKISQSNYYNKNDYLPVRYGAYGYQDDVSDQARSFIAVPLFIIFSIIQFMLVSAIFLAFFGPMILFLLIVQGFLFKATLILMGLMMT